MFTTRPSADITLQAKLAMLREKQVCAPPRGGPCTDPNCNRLHIGCAGTNIWCAVSQDEFNKPGQPRVCPYDFARVHPDAYPRSGMHACTGCRNAHVRSSAHMPGCFVTVVKISSQEFTLEPMNPP